MIYSINVEQALDRATWKRWIVAVGVLGTLALFVLAWIYPNFPGDEGAIQKFQGLRTGWLDDIAVGLAKFGNTLVFLPVIGILAVAMLLSRRHSDAFMIFAGLAVIGLGNGFKELIGRARPDYHILGPDPTSLSFPSGHTLLAVVLGGIIVFLVNGMVKPPRLRQGIQAAVILMVLAMGASRVYMGVHWPSDVIGSFVFGGLALVMLVALRNALASVR
ncbi:MAG: phosphatase PAP2 family protein [SAR202 cluster bacterium]|nr:hypothetical protein [Chloroflexota bacterium]MQF96370.1 phosphatase PAP2 family protein [SAR202 cluster bacterium]HAA94448.1 hypothetical protein [Dehalococcoidia bacterium]MQG34013.1 phosphatase PAP2 family protein [SAR202 cluster bacterium]HCL25038.1 hypothetical protein [Dehalococcoidia bacterium]